MFHPFYRPVARVDMFHLVNRPVARVDMLFEYVDDSDLIKTILIFKNYIYINLYRNVMKPIIEVPSNTASKILYIYQYSGLYNIRKLT